MKSYTTLRNLYGVDTKNTSTANLSYGDQKMNDYHRRLLARANWPFLLRERFLTTYAPTSVFTAVAGTDVCTATSTILTTTGTPVTFSTTTTLPAGLSTSTTYYLIYQSASTFKVATTLSNAFAGTAVDITDTGTGTHTVSVDDPFLPLSYDTDLVESVSVKVDSTVYVPDPISSKKEWDELQFTQFTSDIPQKWFVFNGKIGLYPRPATAGNLITLNTKIRVPDLSIADITSTTIDTLANGSQALTVSGGLTKQMVGFWIRPTLSTTANTGDGNWYEIGAVIDATTALLVRPYGGVSISGGTAAATISQMPLLPEAFHDLPEQYAAYIYWTKEKDERAAAFKQAVDEGEKDLFKAYSVNDVSMVLDSGDDQAYLNPNLTISL